VSGQKIVVLGTGGTIAGTSAQAGDNIGYTAAQVGVGQLLAAVPGLQQAARGVLVAEQVAQIDSKDMDGHVWQALALRCAHHLEDPEVRGVVITHGTDTLEETAWFLHEVLDTRAKPVVLTCAMRPMGLRIFWMLLLWRSRPAHGVCWRSPLAKFMGHGRFRRCTPTG
jgi:L-asparaginase